MEWKRKQDQQQIGFEPQKPEPEGEIQNTQQQQKFQEPGLVNDQGKETWEAVKGRSTTKRTQTKAKDLEGLNVVNGFSLLVNATL